MSASHKKQLRKEQNAAQMTEKQLAEQKEAKKLRLYTTIFAVVIALMICVVIFTTVTSSGIIERNTTAITVGGTKVSAVELNYYYIDSINNYINQWGDYIALSGIDTTKALNEQDYNADEGTTWADYFVDTATQNIHSVYAIYNKAVAEGYTLSEEDATAIDSTISTMELYGTLYYGYSDLDSYLVAMYGTGANEETYRAYAEVQYVASDYANDHYESLTYTDEEIAAVLAEEPKAYNAYSYNYYYLSADKFLQGGTEGEDGTITYSDEEKAAALEACKAAAESLTDASITDIVLLDKAIGNLEINAEATSAASTAVDNRLFTQLSSVLQDWVTDDARAEGDLAAIPYESETTDEEGNTTSTVNGYYVVFFKGMDDNTYLMNNVRHILVAFEGGTTGEDGTVTYTDEEKAAALAEAEEILAAYLAGEQTEEAFTDLIHEHTDDVDSTGHPNNDGLYENVIPSSNYVENFLNWAIDDARTPGETGIVETEYGYHIMYFVGDSEMSYRDTMIVSELRNEDLTEWEDALIEAATMDVQNTGKVKMDLKLSSGN